MIIFYSKVILTPIKELDFNVANRPYGYLYLIKKVQTKFSFIN